MSEATETHGGNTAGNSEHITRIPSGAATPVDAGVSGPPSRTRRFLAKAEKKIDKFKLKLGLKEKGTESHGTSEASTTAASTGESTTASSGKTWAVVARGLKMTLSGAVPFIPDPFKGPAQALLKIIDIFEQAKSNKEDMEELKARCDLLNESMVNAIKGRDERLLSAELKESIGRLVKGVHDTLLATVVEYSTGMAAYVMAEDNSDVVKEANEKMDQILQCFWIENLIAGALVLSDVLQTVKNHTLVLSDIHKTVKDQEGWMVKLCTTTDNHFKSASLDKLKHVPGAAYDSQELAKVNPCFQGTRVKLLAGIGRWMSNTALEEQETSKPIYVLDGIAGIGKSTVAKTVAQHAAAINSLGATFFFSRDHADRQQAADFVHTIAYQLACCDASYGRVIAAAIDDHPESLHKIMAQQFSVLVAEPLSGMLKQRATPLVFVFDALDECAQPDASDILSLIIGSISKLPNVKVFLTTRPQLVLRIKYQSTALADCFHLQEIEAVIVDSDIRLYLGYYLSVSNIQKVFEGTEWDCWSPTKDQQEQLVRVSDKLFIFASTAIKLILSYEGLGPVNMLASILNLEPKQGMVKLYQKVLEIATPTGILRPSKNWDLWLANFKTAVGTTIILQYPISIKALERLLQLESPDLGPMLRNMHSVLAPFDDGPNPTYKIHHKSFPDFITNADVCPQEFWIEESKYHLQLGKCCLRTMNQQLCFNICQVSAADQYKELANLPELNKEKLTEELKYAVCNWAAHFARSKLKSFDKETEQLLQRFTAVHLIHWFEALAYLGQLDTAFSIMHTALTILVSKLKAFLNGWC
ncbi:hypothetical protein EST38_g11027 [Candolleomyces aberdarensis]|uniref:NACHT domain-containing protein n=1 Tax=Candolleomyces aberdarensis TaxID=2316362 RepID=A0A4Q2D5W1_9AGAR|nr:hypothetical protein EST38_g11027 [Candolleomyces aberdarensis]